MEVRLLHEDVDGGGVAAVAQTAALVVLAPLQQHHAVAAVVPGPGHEDTIHSYSDQKSHLPEASHQPPSVLSEQLHGNLKCRQAHPEVAITGVVPSTF